MIDKYTELVLTNWKNKKGMGFTICARPLNYKDLLYATLLKLKTRNYKIYIIYDTNDINRSDIMEVVNIANDCDMNISVFRVSDIKPEFDYSSDVAILINCESIGILQKIKKGATFLFGIYTYAIKKAKVLNDIINIYPHITSPISDDEIKRYLLYTPVEEEHIKCILSNEDREEYDKQTDFINTSISIIGDWGNIELIKYGDKHTGESAASVRTRIAVSNGWSSTLDMSNPFDVQIDDCYNPNSLLKRAEGIYDIIRLRKVLISDCKDKLSIIRDIINNNVDKKILIVSKRGDFASNIVTYLADNNIICGDYHNNIPKRMAKDANGIPIVYKSGLKKGEPKIIGSQAISSENLSLYNIGKIKILSATSSALNGLQMDCDLCIITSPFCGSITDIKRRFSYINFSTTPNKVFKLYCENTIEEKDLTNTSEYYVSIKENIFNEENYIVSENY